VLPVVTGIEPEVDDVLAGREGPVVELALELTLELELELELAAECATVAVLALPD